LGKPIGNTNQPTGLKQEIKTMEENTVVEQEVQVEQPIIKKVEVVKVEPEVKKKASPIEVLRELSKHYAVDLFEDGGLQQFNEKIGAKDVEITTTLAKVDELSKNELLFTQKEQDYQVKIEALGLGFKLDNLDEVLALAKVNTKEGQTLIDGLKIVKEKYGGVFATKQQIGVQHNDLLGDKPNLAKNEQDKYLAESRANRLWEKQKQKYKK